MKQLAREIEANFDAFSASWKTGLETVTQELDGEQDRYLKSYRRLVSLQAWRADLLESIISAESLGFFLEAQNDALVSHVFARCGSWRSALKSLRSSVENICFCLYYMDHPVELQLWESGKHKPGFTATKDYLLSHPRLANLDIAITGLQTVADEYSTLSRAVHASAKSFRMTDDAKTTLLWSSEKPKLGAWETREGHTITALNMLLLSMFREHLQGARLPNLRKSVSFAVPVSKHKAIKDKLGITLSTY